MKNLFLLFIFALVVTQTTNSQKYKIDKNPFWIKEIAIPVGSSVSKYNISAGFYLTLADYQVNLDDNIVYNHQVIKVVSYSGITKASQLTISFDSSYQQVKIHHLYVWRKGEKLNRTNTLSFEKMNNEFQLAAGIYMGRITLYNNLNDIRKDDLIDFAFSIVGKNPIFEMEKYLFIPLQSDNPVDFYNVRILYAKDKDYQYKCVGCDSTIA